MLTSDAASATKGAAAACSRNVKVTASCKPAPARTRRTVRLCEIEAARGAGPIAAAATWRESDRIPNDARLLR